MALDHDLREAAVLWAARTGDPAFDEWEAFTLWLEQDGAHARAYDEVSAAVLAATEVLPRLPAAENDDEESPRARPRWLSSPLAGALAAAFAAIVLLGLWQARSSTYSIDTAPGEIRMVALDGGGRIDLAGGSRLMLDRDDPRAVTLAHGEALFSVEHDAGAPFTVSVGEDRLVDIGTVFDVKATAEGMAVAVAEGAVLFNPDRQKVRVSPGQRLTRARGSDAYRLASLPASEVGEWREGRLTFRDAGLAEIAADLSRATGVEFTVAAGSPPMQISGSLAVEPVRADPQSLGPLLGVAIRRSGAGWEIGAP